MTKNGVHEVSTLKLDPRRGSQGAVLRQAERAVRAVERCAGDEAGAIPAAAAEVRALDTLLEARPQLDHGVADELRRLAVALLDAYLRLDERTKDALEAAFGAARPLANRG